MTTSRDLVDYLLTNGVNPHATDGQQPCTARIGYWRIRGTIADGTCVDAYFVDPEGEGCAQPHPRCALWLTIRESDGTSCDAYELGLCGVPTQYALARPVGLVHEVPTYRTRALPTDSYPAFLARALDTLRDPSLVQVPPRGFLQAGPP